MYDVRRSRPDVWRERCKWYRPNPRRQRPDLQSGFRRRAPSHSARRRPDSKSAHAGPGHGEHAPASRCPWGPAGMPDRVPRCSEWPHPWLGQVKEQRSPPCPESVVVPEAARPTTAGGAWTVSEGNGAETDLPPEDSLPSDRRPQEIRIPTAPPSTTRSSDAAVRWAFARRLTAR